VSLEGEELEHYLAQIAEQKALEEQEGLKRGLVEEDDDDDMSDLDDAPQAGESTEKMVQQYDIYMKDVTRSSGFFKHAQTFRMFPIHQTRIRLDDYGEVIDPSSYMKEEEQTAIEAAATGQKQPEIDKVKCFMLKFSG
jgi:cleavage and polyadenylation specificity factor subunit 2